MNVGSSWPMPENFPSAGFPLEELGFDVQVPFYVVPIPRPQDNYFDYYSWRFVVFVDGCL